MVDVIEPVAAVIARDATTNTDGVWFTVPTIESGAAALQGPARWSPRTDTALPLKGDAALVVYDHEGEPWVVQWWPAALGPP